MASGTGRSLMGAEILQTQKPRRREERDSRMVLGGRRGGSRLAQSIRELRVSSDLILQAGHDMMRTLVYV